MRGCLIQVSPLDPATNSRITVRAGLSLNSRTMKADGQAWFSAISRMPKISMEFMDDDLRGQLQVGRATVTLASRRWETVYSRTYLATLVWVGAPITIYSGDGGSVADLFVEFVGNVTAGSVDKATGLLPLQCEVDRKLIDVPMLNLEYGGGGGTDGDVEVRGQLKPACFGKPVNVPVFFFDQVNTVGQVDGYGNVTSINELYEDAASFGPKKANYASYAALVAATLAEGEWATCHAEGMVRLGAEPRGVITCDPVCGAGSPGQMALRWLQNHAGVTVGRLNMTSFTELDAALTALLGKAPAVSYYTQTQVQVIDRLQALMACCNAVPLLGPDGLIAVSRVVNPAAAALTLNRKGGVPLVTEWRSLEGPVPWWRLKMEAAKTWRVHSLGEIDYEDDLVDLGNYVAGTTYRQGNIVRLASNGNRYLYTHATPGTTAPPAVTHWALYETVPDASVIRYIDGVPVQALQPGEAGANVTETRTALLIAGQGPWATYAQSIASVVDPITAAVSDEWLFRAEKRDLRRQVRAIESQYSRIGARLDELNQAAQRNELDVARSLFFGVLNAHDPAWNNMSADTRLYVPWFGDSLFPAGWSLFDNATTSTTGEYTTLGDANAAAQSFVRRITSVGSVGVAEPFAGAVVVKKDSIPKTTRFAAILLQGTGGAGTVNAYARFDTSTGEIVGTSSAVTVESHDLGDDWLFVVTIVTDSTNTDVRMLVYPAFGADASLATSSNAAVGSIEIRGAPLLARGGIHRLGGILILGRLNTYVTELFDSIRVISGEDWGAELDDGGLTDGGTVLTPADIVTGQGQALTVVGQGAFATQSAALASQVPALEGQNLILDNAINDPSYWLLNSNGAGAPGPSIIPASDPQAAALEVNGAFWYRSSTAVSNSIDSAMVDDLIPSQPGVSYRVHARLRLGSGHNGFPRLGFHCYAQDGTTVLQTNITGFTDYRAAPLASTTNFAVQSAIMITPPGTAYVRPFFQIVWGGSAPAGNAYWGGVSMRMALALGQLLTRQDGTTEILDIDAITLLGQALTISGQGDLATVDQIIAAHSLLGETANVFPDPDIQDDSGSAWLSLNSATITLAKSSGIRISAGRLNIGSTPVGTMDAMRSRAWPVEATRFYYVGAAPRLQNNLAGRQTLVYVVWYSNVLATTEISRDLVTSSTNATATFAGAIFAAPSNALRARLLVRHVTPSGDGTGTATYLYDPVVRRLDELQVAGSGSRLGDGRNIPAIVAAGVRYRFTTGPTYTAAAGTPATATISLAAGSLRIGTVSISYNAMSVNVTGTGGSTVVYNLYFDNPTYAAGAQTLVATTSNTVPYDADGRIFVSQISVSYPASGTGGGSGPIGGGGGLECVWSEAWVPTDRGLIQARDVREGDMLQVLNEDGTGWRWETCEGNHVAEEDGCEIEAADGTTLWLSCSTPLTLRDGETIYARDLDGEQLPTEEAGTFSWQACRVRRLNHPIVVAHIRCGGHVYAAGNRQRRYIYTHNPWKQ